MVLNCMVFSRMVVYSAAAVVLAFAGGCFPVSPETLDPQDKEDERTSAPLSEPLKERTPSTADKGVKDVVRRNGQELSRKTYLTVIKLSIDLSQLPDLRILKKSNHPTISRYASDRTVTGRYYFTKQGVLLCEEGPCIIDWMVKFHYTDEGGKSEAFLFQSRETVFAGMGPTGTSTRRVDWCLNGDCRELKEFRTDEAKGDAVRGRYTLSFTRTSTVIRRSDIMKEVLDAGRKLSDY